MINAEEQQFLNDLEKKLWASADKLRSTLDAAQYKHAVLGLVFLKYVSDAFDIHRDTLTEQFSNPEHDYFLDPEGFGGADSDEYADEMNVELERRDYYTEANVFWVPTQARWQFLQNNNKTVISGIELLVGDCKTLKISFVGLRSRQPQAKRGGSTSAIPSCRLINPVWLRCRRHNPSPFQ